MDNYKRFGGQERYGSVSPPRLYPGQMSPVSPQLSPVSPQSSQVPPQFSPFSPQLSPVSPQLSPSRELPQLSESQQAALEASFRVNRNPRYIDLMLLGVELGVDEPHIKRWFGHRLACWRQEQGLQPNGRPVDMM